VLRSLVDLAIAFMDLLQAYARQIQESAKRTALKAGVLAGLGIIAVGVAIGTLWLATGLLLWALYVALIDPLGVALAALVTGLVVWLLFGGAAWFAIRKALK
jgi:hypothetical protein